MSEAGSELPNPQTARARDLTFRDNAHHPMFQVSHVPCHVSDVTHHFINHFMFTIPYVSCVIKNYLNKNGQSGGVGWWRVCYHRAYPI